MLYFRCFAPARYIANMMLHLVKIWLQIMLRKYFEKWWRNMELGIAGILHLVEGSVAEEVWSLNIVLVFVKYPVWGNVYTSTRQEDIIRMQQDHNQYVQQSCILCKCAVHNDQGNFEVEHNHLHFLYSANIVAIFLFQYFPWVRSNVNHIVS